MSRLGALPWMRIFLGRLGLGRRAFDVAMPAALFFGSAPAACGGTAEVQSHRDGPGAGSGASGGKGGRSGTGSSGSTLGDGAAAGDTGASVDGGSVVGGGGAGAGAAPSSGGASSAAGSAGVSGAGGVDSRDPHAAERKGLIDGLCSVLEKYPCLRFYPQRGGNPASGSLADRIALCIQDTQASQYSGYGDICFDEWSGLAACLRDSPHSCPCTGNDCYLVMPGELPNPCPTEEKAFDDCLAVQNANHWGNVTGSSGKCEWFATTGKGCMVDCLDDPRIAYGVSCDGGVDSPQACTCTANDVPLHDGTYGDPNFGVAFYADSCEGIAQKMADGQCSKIMNCCFTWTPVPADNRSTAETCSCISDPQIKGEPSCEAVAARGGGKVVDICPQFLPVNGAFP